MLHHGSVTAPSRNCHSLAYFGFSIWLGYPWRGLDAFWCQMEGNSTGAWGISEEVREPATTLGSPGSLVLLGSENNDRQLQTIATQEPLKSQQSEVDIVGLKGVVN
jgi:hypothetical protein